LVWVIRLVSQGMSTSLVHFLGLVDEQSRPILIDRVDHQAKSTMMSWKCQSSRKVDKDESTWSVIE